MCRLCGRVWALWLFVLSEDGSLSSIDKTPPPSYQLPGLPNLLYKGAVNAYFLTGSFFKKTVVFEAAIFVGQPEDGAEVRCDVSRRVETE